MSNQDWSHIGEDIVDAVQSAIEDGNFADLSAVLRNSANLAMEKFQDAIDGSPTESSHRPAGSYRESYERRYGKGSYDQRYQTSEHSSSHRSFEEDPGYKTYRMPSGSSSQRTYGGSDHYNDRNVIRQATASGRQAYAKARQQAKASGRTMNRSKRAPQAVSATMAPFMKHRDRYKSPGLLSVPGYIGAILGGLFGGPLLLSELILIPVMMFSYDPDVLLGMGVMLPILGVSLGGMYAGIKRLSLVKKFKKYVSLLDDKEFFEINDLADMAGESKSQVLKNLRKMIGKGWFRQGHLDKQNKNIIVTDAAFKQYLQAQRNYERQEMAKKSQNVGRKFDGVGGVDGRNLSKEASAAQAYTGPFAGGPAEAATKNGGNVSASQTASSNAAASTNELPEEVRSVIREGREYLRQVKASNEAIPGEEISNKISRMERIIDQILDHVELHPELVDDLRRFMKYYLPTTCKLLKAYEELDRQAVQGPNIMKSKADIEETLDTINQAFENLLDGFFATSSMDIASDISVMQTLMSQEGLLESEMKKTSKAGVASSTAPAASAGEIAGTDMGTDLYPDDDPIAQMLHGSNNGNQEEVLRR
ncbi:MAG: 5-bromo-4-chloroindolyl phosphate hydrolysis family protein [Dorea sp.]|nr:5-bromo-4-chloroindolyl phosphate hydrolysis family protein [Dorea sp.]